MASYHKILFFHGYSNIFFYCFPQSIKSIQQAQDIVMKQWVLQEITLETWKLGKLVDYSQTLFQALLDTLSSRVEKKALD